MARVDCFQDNYGYWRARRGEFEIGPQRTSREEALSDMEGLYQEGDFLAAEGQTRGSTVPATLPPPPQVGERGLAAGTGGGQHARADVSEASIEGHFAEAPAA